jgi:pyruvate,orthophosphate dikinase
MPRWVYLFDDLAEAEQAAGGDWEEVRGLLGGKGAALADMTRLGLPVPPGFVVTTAACNAYLAAGGTFPPEMWEQELEALQAIEAKAGSVLGDPAKPLLVSCRSGAKFSMPGMMDTVLNLGLTDRVAEGLAGIAGDARFAHDLYRRLIQMFGSVVSAIPDERFDAALRAVRDRAGVQADPNLGAEDWRSVVTEFQRIYEAEAGAPFPQDPREQIRRATESVFLSWNGKRAVSYRTATGIPHDLGTAVVIQAMVFGNRGEDSASGVALTRNATTGVPKMEGDYLTNAQGEDVVAGTRQTKPLERLRVEMPAAYTRLEEIGKALEARYRDAQDLEFTIERGRLWMLQTRAAKRTPQAAVRTAVDMVEEGLITVAEALLRVTTEQVDFFLHPQFEPGAMQAAVEAGRRLAAGLNVSPGAAMGRIVLDADRAEQWSADGGGPVILVRPETKSDDVHGMLVAAGVLTTRGGRTSHAALVARQFGKPAVVGAAGIEIDLTRRCMAVGPRTFEEGEWISIDGTLGEVFQGSIETIVPDLDDPHLTLLLAWADEASRLGVRANADTPLDARRARLYGAQGIGLCRTEHMFFAPDRLVWVRRLILAPGEAERREALEALLPLQREDFAALFREMDGLPVVIRLIDPPLHEFLPARDDVRDEVLRLRATAADPEALAEKEALLAAIERLTEANPMLGLRGVRLGIQLPDLTRMQVRAIFEAACRVSREGVPAHPEVMIPLVGHVNELRVQKSLLEEEARRVMTEAGTTVDYSFGTMIEVPRAALVADRLAEEAAFFSFGTNDLTQMTFGLSRDDAEKGFLVDYLERGILSENPFATIDVEGVGRLMETAVRLGRGARPDLVIGICGEHGGDPKSVGFCHRLGLDYVSCSPFRVPVARLAAAQAALQE